VIREGPLQKIDQAIDLGRQHGIHITLNFHRIPGYCINGCEFRPDQRATQNVGEWGVFNKTPHAVALAWMEDSPSLWKKRGGDFLCGSCAEASESWTANARTWQYEDFKGDKLDRRMLELLRRH
jgi:hypothetical protein